MNPNTENTSTALTASPLPPSFEPAPHLAALLAEDGERFVSLAYLTLLKRPPDPQGYASYLQELRATGDKIGLIQALAKSEEGRRAAVNLPGLGAALQRRALRNLPVVRQVHAWLNQGARAAEMAAALRSVERRLNGIDQMVFQQGRRIESLRNDLQHWAAPASVGTVRVVAEPQLGAESAAQDRFPFDPDWYLKTYPDVAMSGVSPMEHYLHQGKGEGRLGSKAELEDIFFDADLYLRTYPDVAAAGVDPLQHYIYQGRGEGRVGARLPALMFDADWYVKRNPDIDLKGLDPLDHFIHEGWLKKLDCTSVKPLDKIEAEPLVYSEPLTDPGVKLVAFYLPQFHPIPENDRWWGKGFTEWTNVTRAKGFYEQHEQPRQPGELGFYDLRLIDNMKRQAELARAHGVFGFCFYIYWFAGHRLLETPIELLLKHPEIDINFCYCWANENWTRRWDGMESDVLIGQDHSPADDIAFIESISKAFHDRRYIRVDGHPLLVVYRPGLFPDMKATVGRWRDWCMANGVGAIKVYFAESFDKVNPIELGLDGSIQFPPLLGAGVLDITNQITPTDPGFAGHVYSYPAIAKGGKTHRRPDWPQFRGVMPSWDNTARKMERGYSFYGATPELYAEWLQSAVEETIEHLPETHRFVFVNAWNEWAEGAYLEPDRRRGYAYLNRTREVLARHSKPAVNDHLLKAFTRRSHPVAVVVHLYYGDLFDSLADYIDNIPGGADLFFSVRDGCYPEMVEKITARCPNAVVVSYPNHGRDVLPFLHVLRQIDGLGYEAICKVHSKKSKHRGDGDRWRDDVLNKLLGSAEIIERCLFQLAQGVGVLAPAGHLLDGTTYWGSNARRVTELAVRMGCPEDWVDDFKFAAGTMFWFRPEGLRALLDLNLQPDDFEREAGQVDGTTAHAVERLISLSVRKAGLHVDETAGGRPLGADEEYLFAARSR
jgi:lipopolysaccharide biosynthesis protein